MKFWAYRHVNGSMHLQSYRADLANARTSIDDAYDSPFVEDVLEPFEATDRLEAERIARVQLVEARGTA